MRTPKSPFESYMSEPLFIYVSLSFWAQSAKKKVSAICHIQFRWKVTDHFWNRIKKIWGVCTKIALLEKISRKKEKIRRHVFVVCDNLPTVTIWGQLDKFLMSFSFLQCLLQVKKLIQENCAKYVNQTSNFYFLPKLKTAISLPIFNLFQWCLFYIRGFISIITLTEKSKFEENCQSEGLL